MWKGIQFTTPIWIIYKKYKIIFDAEKKSGFFGIFRISKFLTHFLPYFFSVAEQRNHPVRNFEILKMPKNPEFFSASKIFQKLFMIYHIRGNNCNHSHTTLYSWWYVLESDVGKITNFDEFLTSVFEHKKRIWTTCKSLQNI